MRRSLLLCALVGGVAVADVGPPPGTKLVPVTGIVETNEPLTDYEFFLVDSSTYHGAPRPGVDAKDQEPKWRSDTTVSTTTISPGNPIRATGGRRQFIVLYAVPRKLIEAGQAPGQIVAAVDQGKVAGAIRQQIGSSTTIPVSDPRAEVEVRYRLKRNADGTLALTSEDTGDTDENRAGEDSSAFNARTLVWIVTSLAVTAAIVTLGFWWLRRSRTPSS